MNKIIFIFAISFLLISCSTGPEKAAKNFSENLAKGKVDEAKKYATESTGKLLDFTSGFGGLKVDPDFKFKFIKDSIVDNRAWVTFKDESKESAKEQDIELVKVDGEWLIHVESKK
ncbi:DUF4878 domain-containing protein [Weeksellaceae bacterium KMM 9724]|uniref:DUF4878 domain-containing protein n=1 Tax=Profundicola chukchiensis TaxID=2961959 RepID=UPI0024379C11|nr:DUF4878 domain-containing protein [Profundicola chukchiensis]MDG4949453.1 DUF4878 domain-containing protein [Profundicola chukchiensis]